MEEWGPKNVNKRYKVRRDAPGNMLWAHIYLPLPLSVKTAQRTKNIHHIAYHTHIQWYKYLSTPITIDPSSVCIPLKSTIIHCCVEYNSVCNHSHAGHRSGQYTRTDAGTEIYRIKRMLETIRSSCPCHRTNNQMVLENKAKQKKNWLHFSVLREIDENSLR